MVPLPHQPVTPTHKEQNHTRQSKKMYYIELKARFEILLGQHTVNF